MKRSLTAALATLFLLFVAHGVNADPNRMDTSDAMEALLDQVDASYLYPNDRIRKMIGQKSPVNAALLLGITLHGQAPYLNRHPDAELQLIILQDEVHRLLEALCRVRDYKDHDGSRITGDMLFFNVFLPSVDGENNDAAMSLYNVNPATFRQPYILDQVVIDPSRFTDSTQRNHLPTPEPDPGAGKLINKDPCAKCPGMCLLGVCADGN